MKIWSPENTAICFKLEEKTTLKRYQKLEFQTLTDMTSTSITLPYRIWFMGS